jgi:ATPase subunit of ABC transporter with duplicated ATPase domains
VGVLSGGERNRLHLAMTLKNGSNVLLLDEPTNDLDVNTLRALEEGIEDYSGCAVIISHDRWFLTASAPTSSHSRAIAMCTGSKAASAITRRTTRSAWAM